MGEKRKLQKEIGGCLAPSLRPLTNHMKNHVTPRPITELLLFCVVVKIGFDFRERRSHLSSQHGPAEKKLKYFKARSDFVSPWLTRREIWGSSIVAPILIFSLIVRNSSAS